MSVRKSQWSGPSNLRLLISAFGISIYGLAGCSPVAEEKVTADQQFLSRFSAAPSINPTLSEKNRAEFEFFTMLVPENHVKNGIGVSIGKECAIAVQVDPDPWQEMSPIVESLIQHVSSNEKETSRSRAIVAGQDGFMIATSSNDKKTGKPSLRRRYVTTLNHDPASKVMITLKVEALVLEENAAEMTPLIDEIVSSIRSTL